MSVWNPDRTRLIYQGGGEQRVATLVTVHGVFIFAVTGRRRQAR